MKTYIDIYNQSYFISYRKKVTHRNVNSKIVTLEHKVAQETKIHSNTSIFLNVIFQFSVWVQAPNHYKIFACSIHAIGNYAPKGIEYRRQHFTEDFEESFIWCSPRQYVKTPCRIIII